VIPLPRRLAAELVGTTLLLAAVVGSGIMGDRLAGGNDAVALLANSLATGAALVAILLAFGPISGAHLNPCVSVSMAVTKRLSPGDAAAYVCAQLAGAFAGVLLAHGMFGLPLAQRSHHARHGAAQILSEAVATFGLLVTIDLVGRSRPKAVPFAVAAWIVAAYWFTASTSFANPAVTLARALTDTFTGIRPADVPGFLLGQALGAFAAGTFVSRTVPGGPPAAG
jgi:glycerol uptake facilitator-like aquaporin